MNRKVIGGFLMIVVIAGILGTYLILIQSRDYELTSENLFWSIQVGDEFIYSLNESGGEAGWGYAEALNVSRIIVKIVDLPDVSNATSLTFGETIVSHMKVECYFENGSKVDEYWPSRVLSHLLLPIGDWDFIDALYTNDTSQFNWDFEHGIYYSLYSSKTSSYHDGFYFAHYEVGEDDFYWEQGWLQRETGVPDMINYVYDHHWIVYNANLTFLSSYQLE